MIPKPVRCVVAFAGLCLTAGTLIELTTPEVAHFPMGMLAGYGVVKLLQAADRRGWL